jgi:hypothetical protein
MKNKAALAYSLMILALIACNQTVKITPVKDVSSYSKNILDCILIL